MNEMYILVVKVGKKRFYGKHIRTYDEALKAKQKLIDVGAKAKDIEVIPYHSLFN